MSDEDYPDWLRKTDEELGFVPLKRVPPKPAKPVIEPFPSRALRDRPGEAPIIEKPKG
jgi:hypothetical protein